jgi:hypothetical protein
MTHPFFAETNISTHRDLRRRVSKAYSMSYVLQMEKFIDPLVENMRTKFTKYSGTSIDMSMWTQYFAFDAVGELAFGKAFGFIENEADFNGLLDAVYVYMTSTATFCFMTLKSASGKWRAVRWLLNRSYLARLNKKIYCDPRKPFEAVCCPSYS